MAEVKIDNVSKVYPGDVKAVDDIVLHVRDQEFVVLVGPSGCGKSTTLRMVAGLEEITDGTIRIGDRVVNDVSPKDRDIAMVFQNYALYPHMSVYKNMAFGLKLRRFPSAEVDRRVHEAAKLLGIEPLLKRKPKALSGGQRQRVAVGRAIVRDPACFLFDEPLSNLDAKLRVETRAELKRLHRRLQTTTIYVTHDQEEAMTLGDRVVVMSNGLIQQAAAPLEVYNSPANRFVAAFVGMPPMNFIDGRLARREDGIWFESEDANVRLDAEKAAAVESMIDEEVVIGIRPEAMHLRAQEGGGGSGRTVQLLAQVIEPLGSMMDVYGQTKTGETVVARIRAEPLEAGASLQLHLEMAKVHLFAPGDYGINLGLAQSALVAGSGTADSANAG